MMDLPILLTGKSAASYVWNTYKGNFVARMAKSARAFLTSTKVCFSEARLYVNRNATKNTYARSILERTVNSIETGNKKLQEARKELQEARKELQEARKELEETREQQLQSARATHQKVSS